LPSSARKADPCRSPYETFQSSGRTNQKATRNRSCMPVRLPLQGAD
jgi:hypothetical protein